MEREIVAPVEQCLPDGRLNRAAVGWARRPLVVSNLSGAWGRKKRWSYWGVIDGATVLSMTIAHLDYAALAVVLVVDLRSGKETELVRVLPLGLGCVLSPGVAGVSRIAAMGLEVVHEVGEDGGARLRVRSAKVNAHVEVTAPAGHETLGVLVPWDERRHQFTSKHTGLRARGEVVVDGERRAFGEGAFAVLDHGRGVWPYRTRWNWAAGAGSVGARVIGFNLGGQWTVGTGVTENAVCVDGRLVKIHEELSWSWDRRDPMQPWRVRGAGVALAFAPVHRKRVRLQAGIASQRLELCFGTFAGVVPGERGEAIEVRDVWGWAEEFRARW